MEIGDLGHLLVVLTFVLSLVGLVGNLLGSKDPESWKLFSRVSLWGHSFTLMGVVVVLFTIIQTHDYRYHYAWSHSSNELPTHYMISCFWEGQEGSFLLWMFWNMILGNILIRTSKSWEPQVMTVFFVVQAFLASMLVGATFGDIKLGSSPFMMLSEVFPDAPVFLDPAYMPENGQGLNPLLQNYWMVIHPPTLFLGFATSMVPFAYVIGGLMRKEGADWIKPALPWTLISSGILGLGIIMGGYWAYETLNFGGYWNWDPVENAVLVPWIVQIAALHVMVLNRRNGAFLSYGAGLVVATFVLVLYSNFLTRSGVLGESSVHAFTDLGLNSQLLLFLGGVTALGVAYYAMRFELMKRVLDKKQEFIENLVLIGTLALLFSSLQILMGTSLPVFNKIAQAIGIDMNKTPLAGADYNKWQIWFAAIVCWVFSLTQFVWWNGKSKLLSKKTSNRAFILIVTVMVLVGAWIYFAEYSFVDLPEISEEDKWSVVGSYSLRIVSYALLLGGALVGIVVALLSATRLWKQNRDKLGGSVAHIGIACMLIGILFSSGYSEVVSLNNTGYIFSGEAGEEFNSENVLLKANEPAFMNDYQLVYRGQYLEPLSYPGYVALASVFPTTKENVYVLREDYKWNEELLLDAGDSIEFIAENTYYKIEYVDMNNDKFVLYPRAQHNPSMGFIASPDIKRDLGSDLYTHVSSVPNIDALSWSEPQDLELKIHDTILLNGYVGTLDSIRQVESVPGVVVDSTRLLATAYFTFQTGSDPVAINPTIVYYGMEPEASTIELNLNLGVKLYFRGITQEKLYFGAETARPDYIIMKAVRKPLINFLWAGTILLVIGFSLAAFRRYGEYKNEMSNG